MILPILAALSVAVGVHPLLLMVPAAMAANCAYMLPVGTPQMLLYLDQVS